jgi:hypothetical protein
MSLLGRYPLLTNSSPSVGSVVGVDFNITYSPSTYNASDSFISLGNNFNFSSGPFTLECDIKTSTSVRRTILSKYLYTGTFTESGVNLDVLNTGRLRFVIETFATNFKYVDSTISINDGNWHTIRVYRSTGDNIFIFIDGINRTGTPSGPGGVGSVSNSVDFCIGRSSSFSVYSAFALAFDGQIRNLSIYNSLLAKANFLPLFFQ